MICTQTVHSTSYVGDSISCAPYSRNVASNIAIAITEGIRAFISILGQTCVWFFSWNLLEVQVVELRVVAVGAATPHNFHGVVRRHYEVVSEIGQEGRLFQHIAYVAMGLLALVAAEAMVASSWIVVDDDDDGGDDECEDGPHDPPVEERVLFWFRSLLALAGQVR